MRALSLLVVCCTAFGCRIERVAPQGDAAQSACDQTPVGDVWVYTSMYRHVIDALQPLVERRLPGVKVRYYQAGSEKVSNRLEAELAAGATQADLLMHSDPFMFERLKREKRLYTYVSPYSLRVTRELVDMDGAYVTSRLSAMVIVHRADVKEPPRTFAELVEPRWYGKLAIGDPLTSGTAATWAITLESRYGAEYFEKLRKNHATVAGGNAAVMQKVESGEASVGVVLLENALISRDRGSGIGFHYPDDGTVVIPGYLAILGTTKNPVAAKAYYDLIMSPEGQEFIARVGDLHAVDPRVQGPRGEPAVDALMRQAMPWSQALLERGLLHGDEVKAAFSRAFAR